MAVVLASKSPRRRELLSHIVSDFRVITKDVDENIAGDMSPKEKIMKISAKKARAVLPLINDGDTVISADTAVILGGVILGKPRDEADAFKMLSALSGKIHTVITAFTVCCGDKTVTEAVETEVTMRQISDDEIKEYIATGEPMDKAGAYGIQGIAGKFVSKINGDYFSVVGLPVCRLSQVLNEIMGG